jgi:hypothetical protein
MDINKYIESMIEQIKSDSEKELMVAKQRAAVEKIAPEFAKIDQKKGESLVALDEWLQQQKNNARIEYDEKIARLDAKYIEDKNSIDVAAQNEKEKIESTIIAMETCEIVRQTNDAVAKLSALLSKE